MATTRSRRRPPKEPREVIPDEPVPNRQASSVVVLVNRVRAVGEAYRARDEQAWYTELRTRALEASLLSRLHPAPFGSLQAKRQRIASERGWSGPAAVS